MSQTVGCESEARGRSGDPADARRDRTLILVWTLLLMGVFCVPWAVRSALWTDEIYSLLTASKPLPDMLGNLWAYVPAYYDHPPLYFILLRGVLYFGDSPIMLRLPSLVFVCGAIWLCLAGFRRAGGGLIPAFALGALLVLHPELRAQSINTRMYPLVIFIASFALYLVEKLAMASVSGVGKGRAQAVALALLLAALFYTNYFAILFGAGLGLFGLVALARPSLVGVADRRFGLLVAIACIAGLILFLPWLPPVLRMLRAEGAAEAIAFSDAPPSRLNQVARAIFELAGGWAGAVFLLLGWLALALSGPAGGRGRCLLFGFCLVVVPFATLAIAIPASRYLNTRYLDFTIPLLFAGAARGFSGFVMARPSRSTSTALVILWLLPTPFFWAQGRAGIFRPLPDWWAAAQIIESNAAPGDSVLAGGILTAEELDYHMADSRRYNLLRGVMRMDDFYVACRDPRVLWYVNVVPVPEAYMKILRRYFPWRVEFPGNRFEMNQPIRVYAKRPFKLPSGEEAPHFEPVPLEYEEAAKRRAQQ